MTDVLLVMLYVAAGIAAAWDARRKGYDDRVFLVLGIILGPILLIIMWLLKPKPLAVGTPVRPAAPEVRVPQARREVWVPQAGQRRARQC